jgi:hypothetical protein
LEKERRGGDAILRKQARRGGRMDGTGRVCLVGFFFLPCARLKRNPTCQRCPRRVHSHPLVSVCPLRTSPFHTDPRARPNRKKKPLPLLPDCKYPLPASSLLTATPPRGTARPFDSVRDSAPFPCDWLVARYDRSAACSG